MLRSIMKHKFGCNTKKRCKINNKFELRKDTHLPTDEKLKA